MNNVGLMDANQPAGEFFEEFIRLEFDQRGILISAKGIGSRIVDDAGERPLGSDGLREFDLTAPITLTRGLKEITYLASKKNPMRVHTMLQRMEGHKGLTFQNYQPARRSAQGMTGRGATIHPTLPATPMSNTSAVVLITRRPRPPGCGGKATCCTLASNSRPPR